MIGAMVLPALVAKAIVGKALTAPVRHPLLSLHGGAIVATHVVAGAMLGGLALTVAALAAREAMRRR